MFSIVWPFKGLLEMHGSALHHRDCPYSELDYNNRQLYGEATKLFTIVSHACVILDKCISFKQGVNLQAYQDTQMCSRHSLHL